MTSYIPDQWMDFIHNLAKSMTSASYSAISPAIVVDKLLNKSYYYCRNFSSVVV